MTMQCSVCGTPDWIAGRPGSPRQTVGPGGTVLLHPIPARATVLWCRACWPWLKTVRAQTLAEGPDDAKNP